MANLDIVDGFKPWGDVKSANVYVAESTIYKGDALTQNANGTVARAAATNALIGVALSDAAAAGTVLVADDPSQQFIGQADDNTIDAQTDMGLNASIIVASADTTYKRSGMEVDASTVATTAALELKILRLQPAVNNALGTNAKVIFKINNHQLGSHTGTAGV